MYYNSIAVVLINKCTPFSSHSQYYFENTKLLNGWELTGPSSETVQSDPNNVGVQLF
jgi:hypothetical protein